MSQRRSGGGLGAAFVLLIFVGAIVKFWAWIAAALGALMVFGLLLWLTFYVERRVDERYAKRAGLVARADQQHAWVLAGDARGTYGEYPPAMTGPAQGC
jgi:ABC-type Fe3+-siderophore transport system permease subunit